MEGFAEVDENKVTILCNGAEEGSSIDLKTAQDKLEKVTLLVDEATTKKEKMEEEEAEEAATEKVKAEVGKAIAIALSEAGVKKKKRRSS
jgi:F0F1-type ATP synthase epsilon subunit